MHLNTDHEIKESCGLWRVIISTNKTTGENTLVKFKIDRIGPKEALGDFHTAVTVVKTESLITMTFALFVRGKMTVEK